LTFCGSDGVSSLPAVGTRAPAFALPAATGGTVRLADYASERNVLVLFYTSGT
jgi:peroxiredoxin